ncbi:hypothetical protein G9C85_15330 [Halorubellus sp. JP-L1]|uniref:hypothetical protein n=1 Tax=Halorubellus sp. JP-L1 TaxID=2715753 RepID=UPI001409976E|nr:hypothetical protein [Halorubellus sp. JP-L1]NHN42991.1 hypothetical protein [Halorubellus sp. JP-L1]
MRRRALLSAAATSVPAFAAGCLSSGGLTGSNAVAEVPTARFELSTIPDAELPSKVLYTVRPAEGDDETAQLFDRILDDGATTEATRPPLPDGRHIAYRDGVYELSRAVIEETPATSYSVKVDVVTDSVNEAAAIRFADLPAVDRAQFAARGLADGDPVGIGTTFLYTDAEREQSVLVPESEYSYVTWDDGAEAEWVVDDAYDTTLNTYRYTANQVATAAEYGRRMRERFAFELAGLSDAQRDIVETASEDGRFVVGPDETPSDAFVAFVDRFRGHEQARGLDEDGGEDLSGRYLVRYQGDVYWAILVVRDDAFQTTTG